MRLFMQGIATTNLQAPSGIMPGRKIGPTGSGDDMLHS
jgi:hypothetical protein